MRHPTKLKKYFHLPLLKLSLPLYSFEMFSGSRE